MCGIAGIYSKNNTYVSKDILEKMSEKIAHRGPDAKGIWLHSQKNIGFTHRRLSIIDLSDAANQPFIYKHLTIIFNGEIYNYIELRQELVNKGYTFTTNSDTEVLCALYLQYKTNMFNYIDGAFAFAIWDDIQKTLLLARDRFGEKPLYYAFKDDCLFFASEMKALWAAGINKTPDHYMFYNYLAFDLLENPENKQQTFYKGIEKLKASHYLLVKENKTELKQYWKLKIKYEKLSINDASEKLFNLLQTSIIRRLRSDVKVGTSFSGGLDSSVIVQIISRLIPHEKQKVFSARFPGYKFDETYFQQLLLNTNDVQAFPVYPDKETFKKNLILILNIQEEPFGSGSVFSQWMVKKTASVNNIKVLLDGQGADEVFGGYNKYGYTYLIELINKLSLKFFDEKDKLLKNEFIEKELLKHSINDHYFKNILRYLRKYYIKYNTPNFISWFNPEYNHYYFEKKPPFKEFYTLNKQLLYDTTVYGLEKLLRIADRNSMYHGVEVRLPYLYHELVEFIFSLPSNFKFQNGYSKYILRKMSEKILPSEIIWRKQKVGYNSPLELWCDNDDFKQIYTIAENELIKNNIILKQHHFHSIKIIETAYFMGLIK